MKRLPSPATPATVKLCDLCGTLNLETNTDCFLCGWSGRFSRDAATIALAWQRLETLYESVRAEHLTARRAAPLGHFGAARPASAPQRAAAALAAWWRRFQDARDLRSAQRAARLHSRMPSPPDQLGV